MTNEQKLQLAKQTLETLDKAIDDLNKLYNVTWELNKRCVLEVAQRNLNSTYERIHRYMELAEMTK